MKARSDALEFTVEKNKFLLLFYYNEIESDIDSLKKEMKSMYNKLQCVKNMQEKVKGDLHLLGVQVKEVARKDKEQQMFQEQQGMTSTITTEEQQVVHSLLNINPQDLQSQEYPPQQVQQQIMDYNPVTNVQQQINQVVMYPQIHNIKYPAPAATVTSQGGAEIVPLRCQSYNVPTLTVKGDTGSENVVISLWDTTQFKMSDHDIIILLTTDTGPDTASQGSVLLSQTPTVVIEQQQPESQDADIEEIPQEPPKKKCRTKYSSKVSEPYKKHICDDCGKELT